MLFRFALARVRDREVAEDLVQETFVSALRSRDGYEGRASERTWLVAILRHKILDHFRRVAREVPVDTEQADTVEEALFDRADHWQAGPQAWRNPDAALQSAEFWAVFNACLQGLPERHAQIYAMHAIDESPGEEVCQVFEITPSNLWVILHRARLRLRNCLEAKWFGNDKGTASA